MAAFMESQKPPVFTKSNNEGVQRVLESDGNYAYLMESNSIQYQIERQCDLIQIGSLLDSKGYGIAFTPGGQGARGCKGTVSRDFFISLFLKCRTGKDCGDFYNAVLLQLIII